MAADAFIHRLVGAAMLDITTYEEIEADRSATLQALTVVLLSGLAAGIGARGSSGAAATLAFFTTASVVALLTWASFALLTFEIGARILPTADTRVTVSELLRTLGFAATPGLLQVFGIFPGATALVFTVAIVWSLAASVVAVRQALDYSSTRRALAVCGLALLLSLPFALVLGLFFGPTLSGSMWASARRG
ncbi:MAG TPA: YIP1 family protein [Vicinamibacterales bacterium]|jgi:hypothetical protein